MFSKDTFDSDCFKICLMHRFVLYRKFYTSRARPCIVGCMMDGCNANVVKDGMIYLNIIGYAVLCNKKNKKILLRSANQS